MAEKRRPATSQETAFSEGVDLTSRSAADQTARRCTVTRDAAAGVIILTSTAAVAAGIGSAVPALGAPAIGLIVGVVVRQMYEPAAGARDVFAFGSRTLLQAAIVVLGATFGLGQVASIGRASMPVMLLTLIVGFAATVLIARPLRIERRLSTMIGVGTAICGASAIGAVSSVIAATETEVAYALSTIFAFNVLAVVLYPTLGHLIGLSQHAFGLWAGTAINDTSSVIAASVVYGHPASHVAVVTKLARATMIIPVTLGVAALELRTRVGGAQARPWHLVPSFLLWFLAASALNTAGLVEPAVAHRLTSVSVAMITVALAAVGLSTKASQLRRTGTRPLLLGAVVWALIATSGLLLQKVI